MDAVLLQRIALHEEVGVEGGSQVVAIFQHCLPADAKAAGEPLVPVVDFSRRTPLVIAPVDEHAVDGEILVVQILRRRSQVVRVLLMAGHAVHVRLVAVTLDDGAVVQHHQGVRVGVVRAHMGTRVSHHHIVLLIGNRAVVFLLRVDGDGPGALVAGIGDVGCPVIRGIRPVQPRDRHDFALLTRLFMQGEGGQLVAVSGEVQRINEVAVIVGVKFVRREVAAIEVFCVVVVQLAGIIFLEFGNIQAGVHAEGDHVALADLRRRVLRDGFIPAVAGGLEFVDPSIQMLIRTQGILYVDDVVDGIRDLFPVDEHQLIVTLVRGTVRIDIVDKAGIVVIALLSARYSNSTGLYVFCRAVRVDCRHIIGQADLQIAHLVMGGVHVQRDTISIILNRSVVGLADLVDIILFIVLFFVPLQLDVVFPAVAVGVDHGDVRHAVLIHRIIVRSAVVDQAGELVGLLIEQGGYFLVGRPIDRVAVGIHRRHDKLHRPAAVVVSLGVVLGQTHGAVAAQQVFAVAQHGHVAVGRPLIDAVADLVVLPVHGQADHLLLGEDAHVIIDDAALVHLFGNLVGVVFRQVDQLHVILEVAPGDQVLAQEALNPGGIVRGRAADAADVLLDGIHVSACFRCQVAQLRGPQAHGVVPVVEDEVEPHVLRDWLVDQTRGLASRHGGIVRVRIGLGEAVGRCLLAEDIVFLRDDVALAVIARRIEYMGIAGGEGAVGVRDFRAPNRRDHLVRIVLVDQLIGYVAVINVRGGDVGQAGDVPVYDQVHPIIIGVYGHRVLGIVVDGVDHAAVGIGLDLVEQLIAAVEREPVLGNGPSARVAGGHAGKDEGPGVIAIVGDLAIIKVQFSRGAGARAAPQMRQHTLYGRLGTGADRAVPVVEGQGQGDGQFFYLGVHIGPAVGRGAAGREGHRAVAAVRLVGQVIAAHRVKGQVISANGLDFAAFVGVYRGQVIEVDIPLVFAGGRAGGMVENAVIVRRQRHLYHFARACVFIGKHRREIAHRRPLARHVVRVAPIEGNVGSPFPQAGVHRVIGVVITPVHRAVARVGEGVDVIVAPVPGEPQVGEAAHAAVRHGDESGHVMEGDVPEVQVVRVLGDGILVAGQRDLTQNRGRIIRVPEVGHKRSRIGPVAAVVVIVHPAQVDLLFLKGIIVGSNGVRLVT